MFSKYYSFFSNVCTEIKNGERRVINKWNDLKGQSSLEMVRRSPEACEERDGAAQRPGSGVPLTDRGAALLSARLLQLDPGAVGRLSVGTRRTYQVRHRASHP